MEERKKNNATTTANDRPYHVRHVSREIMFSFLVRVNGAGILVRMNYLKEKENHLCYLCGVFALLLTRFPLQFKLQRKIREKKTQRQKCGQLQLQQQRQRRRGKSNEIDDLKIVAKSMNIQFFVSRTMRRTRVKAHALWVLSRYFFMRN